MALFLGFLVSRNLHRWFYLCCNLPRGTTYVFVSCLLSLRFLGTYTYVSLCISEGFVIVAYVADGYLGVGMQRG